MWTVLLVLAAALLADSYSVHDLHERLSHGRQLKIYLPKSAEKLEFSPAQDPAKTYLYWERGRTRSGRGRVSGTGSDRRWYIDKVTYEDEGTYTQRDYWNREISTVKVAVTPRNNYIKCVAGESLYVSLEGLDLADSFLFFSGSAGNFTLVQDGARVSQDLPEYWDRVLTHSMNIEIRNVNVSDEGHYTLKDRRGRVVSITRMDLTDHHDGSEGNPLLALLLLLGIPAGVCCCCRKKIFKKKPTTASTLQASPGFSPPAPGPAGPAPPYSSGPAVYYHSPDPNAGTIVHPPPQPSDPAQWYGPPPSAGFNPAYPPAAPQWNGPPPAAYPPGPAPMAYGPAPVMYSCPPADGATEELKKSSPAEPLLTYSPQADSAQSAMVPPPSLNSSSSDGMKFQIDEGKSSTNFL